MDKSKQKFTINDNNVSSKGQLPEDKYVTYIGNKAAKRCILIVGNSITRHAPKAEIGWHGDFGMAASCEEKDYVHLLASRILAREDACIMVHQLATWERECTEDTGLAYAKASHDFHADTVIFRLGENIKSPTGEGALALMEKAFSTLADYICPEGARVIFTTCFWRHGVVDEAIRAVAKKRGISLVELGDLGDDDRYMAVGLFEHRGVAMHPGDLGMAMIAERIYKALEA